MKISEKLLKVLEPYKNETIVLLGHDNIDCDSAVSIVLMSKLLSFLGYKNKIVITDKKIHDIDIEMLLDEGVDLNKYKGDTCDNDVLFILDHYITSHKGNVIACIDHHPTSQDIKYPFYFNDKSSSTGKHIYDIMSELNYPVTIEDIRLIVLSIMMDTSSLKSTKALERDKHWVTQICKEYNVDYNKYYTKGLCLSRLNKSIEEIVREGQKKYVYNGINVTSSYIQINGNVDIKQYINYIQQNLSEFKLWVFLVHDFSDDTTTEYRITENNIKCIKHPQITSRGKDIMPVIEKNIKTIIVV